MDRVNVILNPIGLLLVCHQSPHDPLQMPAKLFRRVLLSSIWKKHQNGCYGLHEAAQLLAQQPFLASAGWAAIDIAHVMHNRVVMTVPDMALLLDFLREQLHLRVVCICNASSKEFARLRNEFPALFAKFHATFASGEEGASKGSLRFFQIAMEKAGIHPAHTLYLDSHDLESMVAARSLGMHALLVPIRDTTPVQQLYHDLIRDILLVFNPPVTQDPLSSTIYPASLALMPLSSTKPYGCTKASCKPLRSIQTSFIQGPSRPVLSLPIPDRWRTTLESARQFLLKVGADDPGKHDHIQHASFTVDGIQINDTFSQFLMADALNDPRFLPMQSPPANGLICFIHETPNLDSRSVRCGDANAGPLNTTSNLCALENSPEDLDSTSMGLSVLHKFGKVGMQTIHDALDKMLEHVSEDDGILQVYFDPERPRIDPVAVANTVFLFHLAERGHEVENSERFVESVLRHRAYEEGTLYYKLGEAFLVSVARLVNRFEQHFTQNGMRDMLAVRLQELAAAQTQMIEGGDCKRVDVLALVMRLRACALCGLIDDDGDALQEEVGRAQKENGSWDGFGFYRYGSDLQNWIGNDGLNTAYAYNALLTNFKFV